MTFSRVIWNGLLYTVITGGTFFAANYNDDLTGARKTVFWVSLVVAIANGLRGFTDSTFSSFNRRNTPDQPPTNP